MLAILCIFEFPYFYFSFRRFFCLHLFCFALIQFIYFFVVLLFVRNCSNKLGHWLLVSVNSRLRWVVAKSLINFSMHTHTYTHWHIFVHTYIYLDTSIFLSIWIYLPAVCASLVFWRLCVSGIRLFNELEKRVVLPKTFYC